VGEAASGTGGTRAIARLALYNSRVLKRVAKRLGWAFVTLVGVTMITFGVVYRIPADPAALLAGRNASPETVAAIRRKLRLDQPVPVQYAEFVGRLAHGDLGKSYAYDRPVSDLIASRIPATLQLALAGWLCWLAGGTLAGVWAAARPGGWREGWLLTVSILGVSTPTFWVGILLLYLFVSRLNWLPAGGMGTPRHLVLPVVALAVSGVSYYARLVHSSLAGTLREDYIRTARAKGLSERAILWRHALRNALLPLVTVAGADLASLLGGVVFTEKVFDWQGLGQLAVGAVEQLDIPLILGVVLVSAALVVAANLVVDLIYPLIDPRIRSAS
jgi:peptide/nickel transport system permease protein